MWLTLYQKGVCSSLWAHSLRGCCTELRHIISGFCLLSMVKKQRRLMTRSHYTTLSLIFGSLTGFWSSPTKAPDHKQINVGSALIVCVNRWGAADAYQISSTLNISTCQGFCHFLTLIVWVSIPPTPGCGSTHDTHWGFLLVKYLVVCDPHIMWKA